MVYTDILTSVHTHTHPSPSSPPTHTLSLPPHTQDYDWRQYASVESADLGHDRSLHSRLTNAPHPIHTLPLPTTTATTHSNSSEMESTLSESMVGLHNSVSLSVRLSARLLRPSSLSLSLQTLSGWTERFKDAARGPILDSLDTR